MRWCDTRLYVYRMWSVSWHLCYCVTECEADRKEMWRIFITPVSLDCRCPPPGSVVTHQVISWHSLGVAGRGGRGGEGKEGGNWVLRKWKSFEWNVRPLWFTIQSTGRARIINSPHWPRSYCETCWSVLLPLLYRKVSNTFTRTNMIHQKVVETFHSDIKI